MNPNESLIESHLAYKGKILTLRLNTYQFGKRTKVFEIVHHPGAVVIIPIDAKGRILLVRQWRHAIQKNLLELPAGKLENGEDPLFCAQRELQEETGFRAQIMTSLHGFYSTPGFSDEYLSLFLGENLVPSPLPPDEDEQIELEPLELQQALQMIEEGSIIDAKSIAGILRFAFRKKRS